MTDSPARQIPPPDTAADPIHTPADLRQRWQALMGPLGFTEHQLWFVFIGADRCPVKVLTHLEIPPRPSTPLLDDLMGALHQLLVRHDRTDTTIALLLTGPGHGPLSSTDRVWARRLREAAARHRVPLEPIFAANDDAVLPLPAA